MRQLVEKAMLMALLTMTAGVVADPEMRCRIDGAYIKVYGRTEAEQRETCERQGGELAPYIPHEQHEQGNQGSRAMNSIMGR